MLAAHSLNIFLAASPLRFPLAQSFLAFLLFLLLAFSFALPLLLLPSFLAFLLFLLLALPQLLQVLPFLGEPGLGLCHPAFGLFAFESFAFGSLG